MSAQPSDGYDEKSRGPEYRRGYAEETRRYYLGHGVS